VTEILTIERVPREQTLQFWDWLQQIPHMGMVPTAVLARCLTGEYFMLKFLADGKSKGLIIYTHTTEAIIFVVGIYGPKEVLRFKDVFLDWCRAYGITNVHAWSVHDIDVMGNICGIFKSMKRKYYYEWEV